MYAILGIHPSPWWTKLLPFLKKQKNVKVTSGPVFVGTNTIDDIMLLEIPPQPGRITVALPNCTNPPKM